MTVPGKFACRPELFWMLTSPETCGHEVSVPITQLVPSELARGAPIVVNRIPAEAVVELETIVLLMMFTFRASTKEIPAPSQPATLSAMMLLVTVGDHHCDGVVGNASTSEPLMFCKRRPPPLPVSAALPMIRLALMTRLGPMPSLGVRRIAGSRQSMSIAPPHVVSTSGVPMTRRPPPLAGIVGLRLWLNRIELCSMSPL